MTTHIRVINCILRISDDEGNWISNKADIKNFVHTYFFNFLVADGAKHLSHIIDLIQRKVTESVNFSFEAAIS